MMILKLFKYLMRSKGYEEVTFYERGFLLCNKKDPLIRSLNFITFFNTFSLKFVSIEKRGDLGDQKATKHSDKYRFLWF